MGDKGATPSSNTSNKGATPTGDGYTAEDLVQPTGGNYPTYGNGYRGGYGRGYNTGPSDQQKDAARNLRPIVNYNYETLGNKFDLGDKVYDTADEQSQNMHDWQVAIAGRNASGDWYRQQQKLQSSMKNMRDEMGNAAYGSDFADMYEDFARADDQMDDETLRSFRKNLEEVDANYFEALANNINSRNKLAADTEIGMRELAADYAAQLNNIHPDIATEGIVKGKKEKALKSSDKKIYESLKGNKKALTSIEQALKANAEDENYKFDLDSLKASDLASLAKSGGLDKFLSKDQIKSISKAKPTEYESPAIIDRENNTLNVPDWLDTDFASSNWTQALRPPMRDFYRPDLAAQTASGSGLRNRATNTASTATRRTQGIASYLQPYSGNSMNRRTQ